MKKAVIFLLPLLLWGCTSKDAPIGPMCRVVNQVRVTATVDGQTTENTYTEPEQIGSVLCYLRLLQKGNRTDIDPDSFRSDSFEITLFYSDGQQTTYRQLHTELLQIDDGPWQRIDGAKMELLFP